MDFALEIASPVWNEAPDRANPGQSIGIIGSLHRAEYTGMGMAVKLAARFMTSAAWGELMFDDAIRNELKDSISW
jgi:hypothetical protein